MRDSADGASLSPFLIEPVSHPRGALPVMATPINNFFNRDP